MAAMGLKCTNINLLWQDHLPKSVVLLASRDLPRAYPFYIFFKIKQGRIQGGDRRGLEPPLLHTKKHISSINEEEKEEEEEKEREEEGVVMHRPSQMGIN